MQRQKQKWDVFGMTECDGSYQEKTSIPTTTTVEQTNPGCNLYAFWFTHIDNYIYIYKDNLDYSII